MGFLNALTGGILGGIMGSPKTPEMPAQVKPAAAEDTKSAAEIAADEDAKKKAALIAANAGSGQAPTVGGSGPADVTRKILLGL